MADSLVQISLALAEPPATVSERLLAASSNAHSVEGLQRLGRELANLSSRDCKAAVRVDSLTRGVAAGSITCVQASSTVGDKVHIRLPGHQRVSFTAAATTTLGSTYANITSNTAVGAALAATINAHHLLSKHIVAANTSGTVSITAREPGSWAHSILLSKTVTTGAAHVLTQPTGGDDAFAQPSVTVTFGTPNIAADDTVKVGSRTYTWKASASGDGEITLSTTETTAATNFAAAVNADSTWTGILSASVASAVVTLSFLADPRLGEHVGIERAETNSGSVVLSAANFAAGSTLAGSSTTRTYGSRGLA